jgi:hypothetical protein
MALKFVGALDVFDVLGLAPWAWLDPLSELDPHPTSISETAMIIPPKTFRIVLSLTPISIIVPKPFPLARKGLGRVKQPIAKQAACLCDLRLPEKITL